MENLDELKVALEAERKEMAHRLEAERENRKKLEICVSELKEELELRSGRVCFLEGQVEAFKFVMEHTRRC